MTVSIFRFSLISLFVLSACTLSSAEIDIQNEKEVRSALAGTWEAEFQEIGGMRNNVPESTSTHVSFNSDGSFSAGVKEGVIKQKGGWSYTPESHKLVMQSGKDQWPVGILKLTRNKLILSEYTTSNDVIVDSIVVTYKKI